MARYMKPDKAALKAVVSAVEHADEQYQYVVNVGGDCQRQILSNYRAEKRKRHMNC